MNKCLRLYKYNIQHFSEEKLLHEEVHTNWDEAQRLGVGGDIADELRPYLPPGVRYVSFLVLLELQNKKSAYVYIFGDDKNTSVSSFEDCSSVQSRLTLETT